MSPLIDRILEGFSGSPKIAILMSGKGSNAESILEKRHRYPNLRITTLVTDRKASRAPTIAERHGLRLHYIPGSVRDQLQRQALFQRIAIHLRAEKIDLLLYAGFMKISTPEFCREFPGINCHPADLTLVCSRGKPKYTGMRVIEEALEAKETYLASTVHVVDSEVDCGTPIAVSNPLALQELETRHIPTLHELLKVRCEHLSYPKTIEILSQGGVQRKHLPLRLKGETTHAGN